MPVAGAPTGPPLDSATAPDVGEDVSAAGPELGATAEAVGPAKTVPYVKPGVAVAPVQALRAMAMTARRPETRYLSLRRSTESSPILVWIASRVAAFWGRDPGATLEPLGTGGGGQSSRRSPEARTGVGPVRARESEAMGVGWPVRWRGRIQATQRASPGAGRTRTQPDGPPNWRSVWYPRLGLRPRSDELPDTDGVPTTTWERGRRRRPASCRIAASAIRRGPCGELLRVQYCPRGRQEADWTTPRGPIRPRGGRPRGRRRRPCSHRRLGRSGPHRTLRVVANPVPDTSAGIGRWRNAARCPTRRPRRRQRSPNCAGPRGFARGSRIALANQLGRPSVVAYCRLAGGPGPCAPVVRGDERGRGARP